MCGCKSSYDGEPCKCKDKSKKDKSISNFSGEDAKNWVMANKITIAIVIVIVGVAIWYFKFRK
jgi:Tfp pilus assembly protein PilO